MSRLNPGSIVSALQGVPSGAAGVLSDLLFLVLLLFFPIIETASLPRRSLPPRTSGRPGRRVDRVRPCGRQYVLVSAVLGVIVALVDVAALIQPKFADAVGLSLTPTFVSVIFCPS